MTDTPPPVPTPDEAATPAAPVAPATPAAPANPYAAPAAEQAPAAPQPTYAQPQPGYAAQPGYAQQPYATGYAPKTNVLAIISLVASLSGLILFPFIGPVAGVIMGHLATNQIKRTGEAGQGLAKAGLIIGYILAGLTVLVIIGYIIFVVVVIGASTTSSYYN